MTEMEKLFFAALVALCGAGLQYKPDDTAAPKAEVTDQLPLPVPDAYPAADAQAVVARAEAQAAVGKLEQCVLNMAQGMADSAENTRKICEALDKVTDNVVGTSQAVSTITRLVSTQANTSEDHESRIQALETQIADLKVLVEKNKCTCADRPAVAAAAPTKAAAPMEWPQTTPDPWAAGPRYGNYPAAAGTVGGGSHGSPAARAGYGSQGSAAKAGYGSQGSAAAGYGSQGSAQASMAPVVTYSAPVVTYSQPVVSYDMPVPVQAPLPGPVQLPETSQCVWNNAAQQWECGGNTSANYAGSINYNQNVGGPVKRLFNRLRR